MPDTIIDSKFRVVEAFPKVAGRQRFLVSDLISGRMAVLEHVPIEGFDDRGQWAQDWLPVLRERADRFARLRTVVGISALGAWGSGPYYTYEDDREDSLQGRPPAQLPNLDQVRDVLADVARANQHGDAFFNLRPELLTFRDDRISLLPGAYMLPIELLVRSGSKSPYRPPELRHAGHLGGTTDGYVLAAMLQSLAERIGPPAPRWWPAVSHMLALAPDARLTPAAALQHLEDGRAPLEPLAAHRSVERLADLHAERTPGRAIDDLHASVDIGLVHLSEGRTCVIVVEDAESGAGLRGLCVDLEESLSFLSERPSVVWLDPLTSRELRELTGHDTVVLVPDYRPAEPSFIPIEMLLASERRSPLLCVVGVRRGDRFGEEGGVRQDAASWLAQAAGPSAVVLRCSVGTTSAELPAAPTSPAAQHLLDLISVLEADAPSEMLRRALPHQESTLPEAIQELEEHGHVRRVLAAGGWWGAEPRLVLRVLRPDALERRRQALTLHRREELHLLLSHLLEDIGVRTLGQRYLRFHHLFAGGHWDAAAAECGPLLHAVQRRNLEWLMRHLQRKLVNSNLAQHFTLPHLLEVLGNLGQWEVSRNRLAEGQRYYERATERLFAVTDEGLGELALDSASDILLAHVELLERNGDYQRANDLLQRFLDRFEERLPPVQRGRVFSERAYIEYRLGRYNAAEERCWVALKLLDPRHNPSEIAQVYSIQGLVRWKTSRYEEAEQYFNSSMALREQLGDRLAMARIYNNLGLLERSRRRFKEALDFHRKSLEIRQDLQDHEGVARTQLNFAWVYFEMRDLPRAEELALRASRQSEERGLRSLRAAAQGLLGEIYLGMERLPEARAALDDAIQQARISGDQAELFMDLRKQASLELRGGQLDIAERLLRESEQLIQAAGSPLEEANWFMTQAELRVRRGDARAGAISYEHAGNNLARVGDSGRAAEVLMQAARLYHGSDMATRARDLVIRVRQLYARDGSVFPNELVELEALVGEAPAPAAVAAVAQYVDVLQRAVSTASTSDSDPAALERLLGLMCTAVEARCALLVGAGGQAHAASFCAQDLRAQAMSVQEIVSARSGIVARARQSLLAFGSNDVTGLDAAAPFYVIPLERHGRNEGCVYLEWAVGAALPDEGGLQLLRSLVQLVTLTLERAEGSQRRTRAAAAIVPEMPLRDEASLENVVGRSAARQSIVEFIGRVRDLDTTVLVLGENGTGKDVVAQAIHHTGARRRYPFVPVNCTAIPESLWERELFGHERGAFTDAHESKAGYFEAAHRGTLLLDEIGDMPWEMQTKFLRVLEEKSFNRIGGTTAIRVDVRIIAATTPDLEAAVLAGRFRRDLYHRLNVLGITLPPLRERRDDISELAQHFLDKHAERMGARPKRLSGEALRVLLRYHWPGNIRELENAMKTALALARRDVLVPEDLPEALLRGSQAAPSAGSIEVDQVANWVLEHAAYSAERPLVNALERALARRLVEKIGEKTMAARLLGISKPTLYEWLKAKREGGARVGR